MDSGIRTVTGIQGNNFGWIKFLFRCYLWKHSSAFLSPLPSAFIMEKLVVWTSMSLSSLNNHTHRKLVNLITLGPQPCLTQWNQAMPAGQPKTGRSWWRGLTECGPLGKGMANHLSILALRTLWTVGKDKMIGYWMRNSLGRYVPNMLLEISGEITPERMKGWSQSKNNTQMWMWLVIEARSDAVKTNIA